MLSSFVSALLGTAALGAIIGAGLYRYWAIYQARKKKRIPEHWQLVARPLFTDVERTVSRWLRQVFYDQQLMLKIPVIRFLSPQNVAQGHHSHDLLKGIYCSFTVCTADGTVVGCIDVPGVNGLKASHRDMKERLFRECGIAYAVLSANNLPTLEGLRASFLGAMAADDHSHSHSEFSPSIQPSMLPVNDVAKAAPVNTEQILTVDSINQASNPSGVTPSINAKGTHGIDMLAVAAARSSLQDKLERNRKTRMATIESLSASMGIVEDSAEKGFLVTWHDSFIQGEEPVNAAPDK